MTAADGWLVAYLVMSHGSTERVESLTERLLELSPGGHVVVHHDASSGEVPWGGRPPHRVHPVEAVPVRWGDWSVVEATLRLVRYARQSLDARWMATLSGHDRPVVDLARWERDVRASGVDGIVSARPITKHPVVGRRPTADDLNFVRYAYRWRALPAPGRGPGRLALEAVRRVSRFAQPVFKLEYAPRRGRWFLGTPRRWGLPPGWTIHSGPQWLALGARAADCVLDAPNGVVSWFEQTWIPDQAFVHTVVYNHPELTLRNERLTYVAPQALAKARADWMVLRSDDFSDIEASGAVFARKFDPSLDASILGLLDALVDRSRRDSSPSGDAGHGRSCEPSMEVPDTVAEHERAQAEP